MLAFLFSHLSILANGAIFCLGFVGVSVAAALIIHRFVSPAFFEEHYEQAGFIFAVIGVVYAVLLAFVAIGVWERFDAAESKTYEEANALVDVYRDAGALPQKVQIRDALKRYTTLLIEDEWPKLADDKHSAVADAEIETLSRDVDRIEPKTMGKQDVHNAMLVGLSTALADRSGRISMGATGLNPIVWTVIGCGAIVAVGFSFLFPFKRKRMQILMVGSLAFSIAIVFYLTTAIDYPFHGDISVQP
ncbi:MAG: DUF4239 domain-containing protein, partial [Candidatus Eremiobacteraeota bacterium]|nr:DUF4239 domain-containing protein [Candidatus Eremiobacteraeota bacterium]